jgi:hypothetical protein
MKKIHFHLITTTFITFLIFVACEEKEPVNKVFQQSTEYGQVYLDTVTNICADIYEIENLSNLKLLTAPKLGVLLNFETSLGCFDYQAGSILGNDTFYVAAVDKTGLEDTTQIIINISERPIVIPKYFSVNINDTLWTYPFPTSGYASTGSGKLIIYAVNPFFANGFNIILPPGIKSDTTYEITNPAVDNFGIIYSINANDGGLFTTGKIVIHRLTDELIEGEFEGQIGSVLTFTNGKFGASIQ